MDCQLCNQSIKSEFFQWGIGQYQEQLFCDQLSPDATLDICGNCNERFPVGALGPEWHWQILGVDQDHKAATQGKQGYVYLITDGECCKIGNSTDPAKRLKSLQSGNPRPLRLVAAFKSCDSERLEKYLHHHFSDLAITGEWFEMDQGHIAEAILILEKSSDFQPDAVEGLAYLAGLATTYFKGLGHSSSVVIPWHVVANRCEVTP